MAACASCEVIVSTTPDEVSVAAIKHIARISSESIAARGRFVVALSGGSMPSLLKPLVESIPDSEWPSWHVFFADERCVPLDHIDSNYRACEFLITKVPRSQVFPLPLEEGIELDDPAALAERYEIMLRTSCESDVNSIPVLDLVLLGMGPDGHTCSLFPGHELVLSPPSSASVAVIRDSPKAPPVRITLTLEVLNAARVVAFIATGDSKAEVLSKCFRRGPELTPYSASGFPCAMVQPTASGSTLTWFLDKAAASMLPN